MADRSVFVRLGARVADYIRGMRAASAATEKLKDETEQLNRKASPMLIRGYGAALAALPVAAAPAAAAVAALPAAITAGGAAAAAVVPAFSGMGDAMEATAVGGVELDNALRGLSPSARSVVGELDALKPTLRSLRGTLQEAWWSRLTGDFEVLATSTVPMLDRRLGAIAGTLGQVSHNTLMWLSQNEQVAQLNRILHQVDDTMFEVNAVTREGAGLWLDLAEAGGPFVERLVEGAAELLATLRQMFAEMRQSGQLDRLFAGGADAIDGLLAALARLLDALFTVFASPGVQSAVALLVDAIEGVAMAAQGLAHVFGLLPAPLQTVIALIALLTATAIPATGAMIRMRASTQATLTQLAAMGPAGTAASKGLGKVAAIAGRLGLAGLAVGVVIGLVTWLGELAGPAETSAEEIDDLTESLRVFAATGEATGQFARRFGGDFLELIETLREMERQQRAVAKTTKELGAGMEDLAGIGATDLGDTATERFNRKIKDLDKSLADLATSGGGAQAALIFAELRGRLLAAGMSVKEIEKRFPEYAKAAELAALSNSALAKGFASADQQARLLADGLAAAVQAGMSLMDVFTALNGAALAFAQAEIAAEEAVDGLRAALKDNGKTMDVNTAKGRANKTALLDVVEAAIAAAQAKYDETGSIKAANRVYNAYIERLRRVLRAAGLTEAQINALIGTYARMPDSVTTRIRTPGLRGAYRLARRLKGEVISLNGRRAVIYFDTYHRQHYVRTSRGRIPEGFRWGGIHKAQDGLITGQLPGGIYSRGPIVMFAEPATGGEALIPRRGKTGRSRQLVDEAASWYGGQVDWPGGPPMGHGSTRVEVISRTELNVKGTDRELVEMVRRMVNDNGGGDVRTYLGRK